MVRADYKPSNWSESLVNIVPAISMYALTAGVSRTFGLPFASGRRKPFEVGLGAGATQTHIEQVSSSVAAGPRPPPGALLHDLSSSGLLSYRRWRPAAAARVRVALPVRALRLSATAGLLATHLGDVRLWSGGWEPTADGSRYRPSPRIWSYGTTFTAPVTLGFGFRF